MLDAPNTLEASLARASSASASRPKFCKRLLDLQIFVIGRPRQPAQGNDMAPVGAKFSNDGMQPSHQRSTTSIIVMRTTIAKFARLFSYMAALLTVIWSIWPEGKSSGTGCAGMGCLGNGLGQAIFWLLVATGAFITASFANVFSYFIATPPRSAGRTLEMVLFMVPPLAGIFFLTRL